MSVRRDHLFSEWKPTEGRKKERKKKKQCMYKPSADAHLSGRWLVGSWSEFREFYTPYWLNL